MSIGMSKKFMKESSETQFLIDKNARSFAHIL